MTLYFRILIDSALQAIHELSSNRLRTLLSLLGVSIGIFCIISVLASVDSLERSIRQSFDKLGNDVVYISKMPWDENPDQNYWKYLRRPNPDYDDYLAMQKKLTVADLVSFSVFIGSKTIKYKSSNVNGAIVIAGTKDYPRLFNLEITEGRLFSDFEYLHGDDKIIIGHKLAESLFADVNPIGKEVRLMGRKLTIVGRIKAAGDEIINIANTDWAVIMPLNLGKKVSNLESPNRRGNTLAVRAKPGYTLDELKDDVIVTLRSERRLSPKEDNDFSLNGLSMFAKILDSFFAVLNTIGNLIGGFSLIVGMFSVANIMFVSVNERTTQIGIKKALGAHRSVIMLEFLIESIILCLIGGLFGLLLVFLLISGLNATIDSFDFVLSFGNISFGLGISIIIGLLAGLIPAYIAAGKDPVEAMRG